MKKLMTLATVLAFAGISTVAMAAPQSEPGEAGRTVSSKNVSYNCGSKRLTVKYGFNKQGLPTYAQAFLNGKTRYMPINLNHSDISGTQFGDDNNYMLASNTGPISKKSYRSDIQIQDPASNIVYKSCSAR